MNLASKQLKKVALKLGYRIKEGKKHLLVYRECPEGGVRQEKIRAAAT